MLARRSLNPSLPIKFALGLLLLGAGFLVMAAAAKLVLTGNKVWPTWLVSESTAEHLADGYRFGPPVVLDLKGKGPTRARFLVTTRTEAPSTLAPA